MDALYPEDQSDDSVSSMELEILQEPIVKCTHLKNAKPKKKLNKNKMLSKFVMFEADS